MAGSEGFCVEKVRKLLQCVAGAKYVNISSCKEEMRALRKCCEDNDISDFSVQRENTNSDGAAAASGQTEAPTPIHSEKTTTTTHAHATSSPHPPQ